MSSTGNNGDGGTGSAPGMYFCHMCSMEIRPLLTPQPTCPRCNGGFVEEIDSSRDAAQQAEEDDDIGFGSFGRADGFSAGADGGLDVGQLLAGVFRGLAGAGQDRRRPTNDRQSSADQRSMEELYGSGRGRTEAQIQSQQSATDRNEVGSSSGSSGTGNQSNNGGFRSGTTRIGPVNVTWGIGSQTYNSGSGASGSGAIGSSLFGAAGAPHMHPHTPTGHDETVRRSLEEHARQHVHDDGMGGAGGAADGRFFNHDNQGDGNGRSSSPGGFGSSSNAFDDEEADVPPELASLRDVFSNLFGGLGDGPAGMLMDMLDGALRGGGRSGDYVWGQQGLDDVITQLMEQTRGSTAPPPASEDAIAKLERFSRQDHEKVRKARNRECSTCMDSFEEDEEDEKMQDVQGTDDDPPERVPQDEQQDELVMMPCSHLFHADCIIPWLKTSSTCPVCRVSIEPRQEQPSRDAQAGRSEVSNGSSSSNLRTVPPGFETLLSGLGRRPTSSSAVIEEREDTDVEDEDDDDIQDETTEQRRERMRRAAEARMSGGASAHPSTTSQHDDAPPPRLPGSFLPADDLD